MRTNGPVFGWRLRRAAASLLSALMIAAVSPFGSAIAQGEPAPDEPLAVVVDQAFVIRLPSPANAVVIGNPAIADATIMDVSTLVITGRSFGTTNLIVLDGRGEVIVDQLITVQSATGLLTVFRRGTRQTFSCTPVCAPTLNVGDSDPAFESTNDQILARSALALGN